MTINIPNKKGSIWTEEEQLAIAQIEIYLSENNPWLQLVNNISMRSFIVVSKNNLHDEIFLSHHDPVALLKMMKENPKMHVMSN